MNKDAREDHTLRNALLLTGGLAVGGIGGIKLAEKAVKANKKIVDKAVKNSASKVKPNTATTQNKTADIKKAPPETTVKPEITTAEKIERGEKLIKELQEQYDVVVDPAKKEKLRKQLESIKQEVASLKLGNTR